MLMEQRVTYTYTVKNRRRFPTFMDALYSKPYRVGIYTLLVELQTLGGARILHR